MGASRHARRPGRDAAMELDEVLGALRDGRIGTGRARTLIALNSIEQVGGFARVDASRMERTGTPEDKNLGLVISSAISAASYLDINIGF